MRDKAYSKFRVRLNPSNPGYGPALGVYLPFFGHSSTTVYMHSLYLTIPYPLTMYITRTTHAAHAVHVEVLKLQHMYNASGVVITVINFVTHE